MVQHGDKYSPATCLAIWVGGSIASWLVLVAIAVFISKIIW